MKSFKTTGGRLPIDWVGPTVVLADIAFILACSVFVEFLYDLSISGADRTLAEVGTSNSFAAALIAGGVMILTLWSSGSYRPDKLLRFGTQARAVTTRWLLGLTVLVGMLFLMKRGEQVSRGTMLLFAINGWVLLIAWRFVLASRLYRALESGRVIGHPTIFLGVTGLLAYVPSQRQLALNGINEVGRIELPTERAFGSAAIAADEAAIRDVIELARSTNAVEILLALDWSDHGRYSRIIEGLSVVPLSVQLLPDTIAAPIIKSRLIDSGFARAFEVQRAPLSAGERLAKRTFDLVIAGLGLVLISPILLSIALAVRLDSPGPAIFRQRRNGFGGRQFTIYKFRSMTVMESGEVARQATRNDQRVTRIGRLLRSSSMDELPQLLNVIKGDMSLVGPRPHAMAQDSEFTELISSYAFRHHVKPGITGWAQVNGFRGETAKLEQMEKRVQYDLWYINNWSLWLDFQIMFRTALSLIRFEAY